MGGQDIDTPAIIISGRSLIYEEVEFTLRVTSLYIFISEIKRNKKDEKEKNQHTVWSIFIFVEM